MANDRLREQREADDERTLGRPELSMPRIALGCGNFGGVGSAPEFFGQGLTEDQALELMDAAFQAGLEWFDTAGAYGVSNFDARQLAAALAAGAPRAVQNSYSLLARRDEPELLPLCAERGVAYLAFSPLAGGWLTGKYRQGEPYPAGSRMTQRPEPYRDLVAGRTFQALARLRMIAAGRGTSMAGLALAWLLADHRVTQIVIGPGRPEHLAPVAEALEHPLTGEERAAVESAVAGLGPGADTESGT
jgi:aryl-alcohol dehydrogenase-like predicted oxidoreductase